MAQIASDIHMSTYPTLHGFTVGKGNRSVTASRNQRYRRTMLERVLYPATPHTTASHSLARGLPAELIIMTYSTKPCESRLITPSILCLVQDIGHLEQRFRRQAFNLQPSSNDKTPRKGILPCIPSTCGENTVDIRGSVD
jgi:hypothetical protein